MRFKPSTLHGYTILGFCVVDIVENVFYKVFLCFVTGEYAFISLI